MCTVVRARWLVDMERPMFELAVGAAMQGDYLMRKSGSTAVCVFSVRCGRSIYCIIPGWVCFQCLSVFVFQRLNVCTVYVVVVRSI